MRYYVLVESPKETQKHGPFTGRKRAEKFAIGLVHGGGIKWSSVVSIVKGKPKNSIAQ